MKQYPKITDTIDLLNKVGTPETATGRFASGNYEMKNPILFDIIDYSLTLVYLTIFFGTIIYLINSIL